MSIITVSLLSHLVAFHFKPLNIFKATTTTQTAESVAKIKQDAIEEVFRRQA